MNATTPTLAPSPAASLFPSRVNKRSWHAIVLAWFLENPDAVVTANELAMRLRSKPEAGPETSVQPAMSGLHQVGLLQGERIKAAGETRPVMRYALSPSGRRWKGSQEQLAKLLAAYRHRRDAAKGTEPAAITTGIVVAGKVMSFDEARAVYAELAKLFGGAP